MNSVLRLIFFFGDILERSGQVIDSFLLSALSKLRQERIGSLNNDDGEKGKIAIGLDWQNNNSARASCFFVHFFTVTARLRRNNAYFHVLWRTWTQDNEFIFLFLNFRIQLQQKLPTFDELEEMK